MEDINCWWYYRFSFKMDFISRYKWYRLIWVFGGKPKRGSTKRLQLHFVWKTMTIDTTIKIVSRDKYKNTNTRRTIFLSFSVTQNIKKKIIKETKTRWPKKHKRIIEIMMMETVTVSRILSQKELVTSS